METLATITHTTQYRKLIAELQKCSPKEKVETCRRLCRIDLYFLLWFALGRKDIEHPWLLARCQEIQREPNGFLDLWSREHYKSTIITYAKTIQDILASHGDDPLKEWEGQEVIVGIFSHTRGIAKGFLRQIMREFESNDLLKALFPDILWNEPKREAPKWSEDDGIIVKRKSNPKESTIEAWGLVDGQPTSRHYLIRVYDDVVTKESVSSSTMIKNTTDSWELSLNLGMDLDISRYIGTRYHFNDTYKEIIKREAAIPRLYPGTDTGTADGEPFYWSREKLTKKRRQMGPYTFACQILQDPKADKVQGFERSWLRHYKDAHKGQGMNKYLLCDPANEKHKKSDYTAMVVIGANYDKKLYVLYLFRDRLNLRERTNKLFELHREWSPLKTGYEKYGKDADIEHIVEIMEYKNYRFDILPLGGTMAKNDRIRRLVPDFENGDILLPEHCNYINYQEQSEDMVQVFVDEEYDPFPVPEHDDLLDIISRIKDEELNVEYPKEDSGKNHWNKKSGKSSRNWMRS